MKNVEGLGRWLSGKMLPVTSVQIPSTQVKRWVWLWALVIPALCEKKGQSRDRTREACCPVSLTL